MKIELRKVSHYPRLSQETEAFNADVYVNGVKRGTVENSGHGGPNNIQPRALNDEIEAYAKTLPDEEMFGCMVPISGDYLISAVLADHLIEKDLKKLLKKKILLIRNGKCYETKGGFVNDTPGLKILNDLPFEEALKLYKQHAVK